MANATLGKELFSHPLICSNSAGFVNLLTANTSVPASVVSVDLVYSYHRTTLVATYSATFVVLVLMSAIGIFCIIQNGESSTNSFSRLLVAAQNPEVDAVADHVVEKLGVGAPAGEK